MRTWHACWSLLLVLLWPALTMGEDNFILLVISEVEVRTTQENGKSWDLGGGAPDLKVSIERTSRPEGELHITSVREDVFKTSFNSPAIAIDKGDEVLIQVLDDDATSSDLIGEIHYEVTAETLKSRQISLEFGQVNKLILRVAR